MAKKKKINCKHGLNHSEEIQARKIKRLLEARDEAYVEMVRELYREWFMKPKESFFDWLTPKDCVLASAIKRLDDWQLIVFGTSSRK
jgi:hypothetical protein